MMMMEGKAAIVTGGAGAIGRSIALSLAREGARVVVNDIGATLEGSGGDAGRAQEVVDEIRRAGGDAVANALSIVEPLNGERIVEAALDQFGRLDLVVNNAGIIRDRLFHKMSWVDWNDVIQVHLNGSFNLSRAAAGRFREQNSGSFVHMTSTSGLIGNFGQVNYMAAKMAIVGLSRGIALDMQRFGVRSNCVAPFAWSRMTESIPANTEAEKLRVARIREMAPEKIAPLVVWLGSDKSAHVSGQIFGVRKNEIFVFSQSRPVRSVHRSEGWTAETIAEHAAGALSASFTPLERSGDVFTWDPI